MVGRGVTIHRTGHLKVPMFNVISAGSSPSGMSFMVPTGSSTAGSVRMVLRTYYTTVRRNLRREGTRGVSVRTTNRTPTGGNGGGSAGTELSGSSRRTVGTTGTTTFVGRSRRTWCVMDDR